MTAAALASDRLWTLEPGACRRWAVGPLELWVVRRHDEWVLFQRRDLASAGVCTTGEPSSPPEGLAGRRWTARAGEQTLRVFPILPEPPVVVRPAAPLTIQPGDEALLFMGIPFWIRLEAEGRLLCEEPVVVLSKSWFGSPTEGVLALAMRTTARRTAEELDRTSFRAVCPLRIRNASEMPLHLERFCLDLSTLAIFRGHTRFWTSYGRLTYRGQDLLSRAAFASSPPPYDGARDRIGEPRLPQRRSRLFQAIETLTPHRWVEGFKG